APPSRNGRRGAWLAAGGVAVAAIAAVGFWKRPHASAGAGSPVSSVSSVSSTAAARSIAVLPFVNQSGHAEDEYFSDGMTDELASALMKVPGLRVAARSSAFIFKGKPADPKEVGGKLNVASVLEGTVRRAGSKLRVTAEL